MLSRHVGAAIAATATTALLATGAVADAATRTVHAGPPAAKAGALPEGTIANAFYPRTSLPRAKAVSFTTPGRFGFVCTVHGPSMGAIVEVAS